MRKNNDDAVMTNDGVIYKNWNITNHAISRYIQRNGGDVGNMISDIEDSWLVVRKDKFTPSTADKVKNRSERKKRYAITNGTMVFVIHPGKMHIVVTSISSRGANHANQQQ